MSGELAKLDKSFEEVLKKIMANRHLSKGVQAPSTRGLQATPSMGRRSGHVNPATKQRSKHRDDIANVKQISSILPDYIPPLHGIVNRDNIPRDYEYTLFTAYMPKGIRVVGSQLGQILLLKNNDFNLGDRENYVMLAPHRYLTKSTRKKPHLVSHPWIKGLAQSTVLNVMKIPCWPLTKFWEFLGHVDLFWNFNSLSKEEHKMKRISWDLDPLLEHFWVLGNM
jgi:hypothetical protein